MKIKGLPLEDLPYIYEQLRIEWEIIKHYREGFEKLGKLEIWLREVEKFMFFVGYIETLLKHKDELQRYNICYRA